MRSGTRRWMRLRNITFLTPWATPPTNEQTRKNPKPSQQRGQREPAALDRDGEQRDRRRPPPAATRREITNAPIAIPVVQIVNMSP